MRSRAFWFFEARFINHMFPRRGWECTGGEIFRLVRDWDRKGTGGRILTEMEKLGDETMGASLGVLM